MLTVYLQYLNAKSPEIDIYSVDVIHPGDLAEHFIDLYQYDGIKDAVKEIFPKVVENSTVNGALVCVPYSTDVGLFYYRTDLLDKYGFSVPKTWDELEKVASVIQKGERAEGKKDFEGFVWEGKAYEGLTCLALEWIASSNGGTIISRDKVITINNENAIAAVNKAAGWIGTISPKGTTTMNLEDVRAIFQGGNAAFMRNWPYAYLLCQGEDSAIAGKFDVMICPSSDGKSGVGALGGWQYGVTKYSKHPDVAVDVVKFLSSYEVQKTFTIKMGGAPTLMSLFKDKEILAASPYLDTEYEALMNAVPRPSTVSAPNYNAVSVAFFTAVSAVLKGEKDAAKAFEELALELKDITGFEIK